jgi:two-component system sensor histidine kinase/response regulator
LEPRTALPGEGYGVGLNYLDICDAAGPQPDAQHVAQGIRHILDGTIRAFSYEYESSSSTLRRWFRVIVTPMQGSRSYGAVVMHINVSDLKQAEAAMHQSEVRLRAIVDTAVDGIVVINERGIIESINPAVTRMFGYTSNQLLGQNVKLLMPDPYHTEHDRYLTNYLQSGQKKVIGIGREVLGLRNDGVSFPIELAVSEMLVDGARKFTGIVRDISLRKQAEAQFRQVVESAPNGMLMIDPLGNITLVNKQVETMFGYSREEMLGRPVEMLIPERFRPNHPAHRVGYFSAPSSRAMGAGRELFGLHKNGQEFPRRARTQSDRYAERETGAGIHRRHHHAKTHRKRAVESGPGSRMEKLGDLGSPRSGRQSRAGQDRFPGHDES